MASPFLQVNCVLRPECAVYFLSLPLQLGGSPEDSASFLTLKEIFIVVRIRFGEHFFFLNKPLNGF